MYWCWFERQAKQPNVRYVIDTVITLVEISLAFEIVLEMLQLQVLNSPLHLLQIKTLICIESNLASASKYILSSWVCLPSSTQTSKCYKNTVIKPFSIPKSICMFAFHKYSWVCLFNDMVLWLSNKQLESLWVNVSVFPDASHCPHSVDETHFMYYTVTKGLVYVRQKFRK